MDGGNEVSPQSGVNGAVARNAVQASERFGPDHDIEVALPAFGKARMTAMAFAIVDNFERIRCKGFAQLILDILSFRHIFSSAPFPLSVRSLN